ncbi:MAG: hypothetical protein HQM13_15220 [SAR324 cluster bacterium]|nr:hypothetical protein [SAR324 cluster bacterium]
MKKIISALSISFSVLLITNFASAADLTPRIPEENLRILPNGREIIGTVREGARLRKIMEKDGWTFVSLEGWVYSPSLKKMPENKNNQATGEAQFNVLHWNWKQVGKMLRIQGVVHNNSIQRFSSVKVILNVSDGQGKELGNNFTYLQSEDIKPGQVNGFKVYLRDVTVSNNDPRVKFSFEYE